MGTPIISLLTSGIGGVPAGVFIFKGDINVPADFPTLAEVKNGWTYEIKTNVTDNDPTKTNTGQSFLVGDVIAWNGTNWSDITGLEVWIDTGPDVRLIVAKPVNFQSFGLVDTDVTTPVRLGDSSNTSYDTNNKTIIGSPNELNDRLFNGLQHPTGFPNRSDSEILYNPATQQLTIQPKAPATSFDYYLNSVKYTITSPQSLTHPATTGVYFFYWDSTNTLVFTATPWNFATDVLISYVIYDTTLADGFENEERHSSYRNPAAHIELHEQIGTYIIDGFALSGYTLTPAVPTDADNTFALASGNIADEDIRQLLLPLADGGPYTLFYRSGAAGIWQWNKVATIPFFTGATYIEWNQLTGGTWQLTETANNNWVNIWIFKVPSINGSFQTIIVTGQSVHTDLDSAIGEGVASLQWGTMPFQEIAPAWKITYRTLAAYGSTGKVRIENVEKLEGTKASLTQIVQSNHNSLSGLQIATSGVTWGHIDDQAQTIDGAKTYSSIMTYNFAPTFTPSSNEHITVKGVEDLLPVPVRDDLGATIGAPGKTVFALSQTPLDLNAFHLTWNGQDMTITADFTVVGTTLTWLNPAILPINADFFAFYNYTSAGATKELIYAATDYSANNDNYRVRSISGTGAHRFSIYAPSDLKTLIFAGLEGQPSAGTAGPNKNVDISVSLGRVDAGEALNVRTASDTTSLYDWTGKANQNITLFDITALLTAASFQANDRGGLFVDNNSIGGANYHTFFRLIYI